MPKQRNFDKLYESLNIHREKETTIPEEERASNNCPSADHSIADSLFEDYSDGRGLLIVKGKRIRITDDKFSEFTELMKDKGENDEN